MRINEKMEFRFGNEMKFNDYILILFINKGINKNNKFKI